MKAYKDKNTAPTHCQTPLLTQAACRVPWVRWASSVPARRRRLPQSDRAAAAVHWADPSRRRGTAEWRAYWPAGTRPGWPLRAHLDRARWRGYIHSHRV